MLNWWLKISFLTRWRYVTDVVLPLITKRCSMEKEEGVEELMESIIWTFGGIIWFSKVLFGSSEKESDVEKFIWFFCEIIWFSKIFCTIIFKSGKYHWDLPDQLSQVGAGKRRRRCCAGEIVIIIKIWRWWVVVSHLILFHVMSTTMITFIFSFSIQLSSCWKWYSDAIQVGHALLPVFSLLSHSCVNNTRYTQVVKNI